MSSGPVSDQLQANELRAEIEALRSVLAALEARVAQLEKGSSSSNGAAREPAGLGTYCLQAQLHAHPAHPPT